MIRTNYSTSSVPSIGFAINASRGGRTSFPVAPAHYIYSQFKHVSGVRAPEGSRGVTINKLKILDVLIEQLSQAKKRPQTVTGEGHLSDEQINVRIQQYETQIRQARAANLVMPYASAPQMPSGMLFNLVA